MGAVSMTLIDKIKATQSIVQRFGDLVQRVEQVGCVDLKVAAPGAGNFCICLQPSDALRMLVTALRAGDGDDVIIEHGDSPAVSDTGRMTERVGVNNPGPGGR